MWGGENYEKEPGAPNLISGRVGPVSSTFLPQKWVKGQPYAS